MKIAFIVSYFPECSPFIVNQMAGLIQRGHQVEIFAVKEKHGPMTPQAIQEYDLLPHAHFFSIPEGKLRRLRRAFSLFRRQSREGRRRLLASLNVFQFGWDALQLNSFYCLLPFQDQSFDILHAHFGPNGHFGVLLKKMGVPGKLITTFYGYDLSRFVKENGPKAYRELFEFSDRVLPICGYFRDKLRQLGCPQEKIMVQTLGIDVSRFAFPRAPDEEKELLVLTIARLVEKKGLDISMQAFARICPVFPNLHYVIAGSGPLERELQALAQTLQVAQRVRFIGTISQDEEIAWLRRAQVFILTSRTAADGDEEGTPTVLLEAQAAGVPVVSTRHSGIPEVVLDGKTGFLEAEGDVAAIASRLQELLRNRPLRGQMAENGRDFIAREFDARRQSGKLEEIYLETMRQDGGI